jgi:predicted metal-binding membrane protein
MSSDAGRNISIVEAALRRDRIIVLLGLACIAALAWAYTVHEARVMNNMDIAECMGLSARGWGLTDLSLLFLMWTVMMAAMMVPSVSPVVLLYARYARMKGYGGGVVSLTGLFVLGYLASWTGFSLSAALAQWGLHEAALVSPMMVSTSPLLGGAILVAAGVFQWTPWKRACLSQCRSPIGFLMTEWREGAGGAFVMGLRHGTYCVGCCWLLMAVLFVTGVMNILWVALIAAFVLIEKLAPSGEWTARTAGVLLAGYGLWMVSQRLLS